jgi:hypothetical protein
MMMILSIVGHMSNLSYIIYHVNKTITLCVVLCCLRASGALY